MLITCTRCAVRNLPQSRHCAFCDHGLQSDDEALGRSKEWASLEAALRQHLTNAHEESLRARERWLESLRERRWLHAALASLLLGLPMSIIYLCWWQGRFWGLGILCLFAFGAGAWSGFQISTRGGGQARGALLFWSVFSGSFIISTASGLLVFDAHFWFMVKAFLAGSAVALLLGSAFGRYLSFDRYQDY